MNILALDPGTTETGFVRLVDGVVVTSGVETNATVLTSLALSCDDVLAIEMIASYGMPVGREVFETCVWIGRYQQAWRDPQAVRLVYRKDVKLLLCGSSRAKDPNVRQALIDLLGPQGTKKKPGPTYGVRSHAWSALGVAVTQMKFDDGNHRPPPLFVVPEPVEVWDDDPFKTPAVPRLAPLL